MIPVINQPELRIKQGDIIKEVECIQDFSLEGGQVKLETIVFPYILVLTQDCDLTWDFDNRNRQDSSTQDKYLFSVIVVPLYNAEQFIAGEHLLEIGQRMQAFSNKPNKTDRKNLSNNENPRYHYLNFSDDMRMPDLVADFKHYFTLNVKKVEKIKKSNLVCSLPELYRELVSQRFSNYLSRIGLP